MPRIISSSDPADPEPWFEYSVDGANMEVSITAANGLEAYSGGSANTDALVGAHSISASGAKPGERHSLAVQTDGTLWFGPVSESPGVLYAHLGWFDPADGTWELLNFVE